MSQANRNVSSNCLNFSCHIPCDALNQYHTSHSAAIVNFSEAVVCRITLYIQYSLMDVIELLFSKQEMNVKLGTFQIHYGQMLCLFLLH